MFKILVDESCLNEKRYVFDVIFNEFLGVSYELVVQNQSRTTITISNGNKKLNINSCFLSSRLDDDWLTEIGIPIRKSANMDLEKVQSQINTCSSEIPIIFGDNSFSTDINNIDLGLDIFGSAFFMLTRYEEVVGELRDSHDRFSAFSSMAYREGFLDRPIINEYVEILKGAIHSLWPKIEFRKHEFRTYVSCDVDHIWDKSLAINIHFAKRLLGDLVKRRSLKSLTNSIHHFINVQKDGYVRDPYNSFEFLVQESKKNDADLAFYFISNEMPKPAIDGYYSVSSSIAKQTIKYALENNVEIGLHPSYHSYNDHKKIKFEKNNLEKVLNTLESKSNKILGGRQHFLRWDARSTPQIWESLNLKYDSTLGYAEVPGFRTGVCYEYSMYDLVNRRKLNLKQRPLVAMEVSFLLSQYSGLTFNESLELMKRLKDNCRQFGGNFTLLWHNSSFNFKENYELYRAILAY